ncbi:MAG: M14 family metallopeptidase [Bdellovibrionota bacterium]
MKTRAFLSLISVVGFFAAFPLIAFGSSGADQTPLWLKLRATTKFERSAIAETGASIEITRDDYVIALGNESQRAELEKMGVLDVSFAATPNMLDFPKSDSNFHNYEEMKTELLALAAKYPNLAEVDSIGKSVEGRDIYRIRISGDLVNGADHPAAIFMGGHHAREHLSMEIPLMLAEKLLSAYATDPTIKTLVDNREIHIVPMVNPDGAEHDVDGGNYKMWRKNMSKNKDGTSGVDLNRNYGYGWGTGGSSKRGSDETYMGTAPFSEPETQAIKALVDKTVNANVLLSFHTFSELILYPWGGVYDPISDAKDLAVFQTMAKKMSTWNGYTPEQSSDLYIASGDTTDWAYAEHKIFAFTFELDPASMWDGGFYPGQKVIPGVFAKNLQACLYMIDLADNPYRATEAPAAAYGLTSPLIH